MRLATIRTGGATQAVRIDGHAAVELGHPDVGALLARPGWREEAAAATGDGDVMKKADTAELVHDAVALIRYISGIITLAPGDLIATGTPDGVGHARRPPRYVVEGSSLVTTAEGVGECRNVCVS